MESTLSMLSTQTKLGKRVDTAHVDKLIGNYKKHRWVNNTLNLGRPDSLSVWYGLEELQSFLDLAKAHDADGIKMFFGVYPQDYSLQPELSGLQTVVLVATRQSKSGTGVVNKSIYTNNGGNMEILAFNFGGICPPFCLPYQQPNDASFPGGIEMDKLGLSIIETSDGITII